jgi:hypothetical protein
LNDTLANENNAWGKLADFFNDFDNEVYQNLAIVYVDDNGTPVAKSPYEPSTPAWTCIAGQVYEMDPQCPAQRYDRDGSWIKSQVTMIKKILTVIHSNYMKSGNQDGSDENAESDWKDEVHCQQWLLFSGNAEKFKDCFTYVFIVFDEEAYRQLGKTLPPSAGRDGESNIDPKVQNDASEEARLKRKRDSKGKGDNNNSGNLLTTIKAIAKKESKMEALKFLVTLQDADEDTREKAKNSLIAMAFDDSD